ncbi:MAG: hypothetical protein AAGG56_11510 [Pseudomonadota bacterium]
MNRGEVLALTGVIIAVVGTNWVITDYAVRGSIADVRVEMAALTSRVDENLKFFRDDLNEAAADITETVEAGLQRRSNEIVESLLASSKVDDGWTIRVANVPIDSSTSEKLMALAGLPEARANVFSIAGKFSYEFAVPSLTDQTAMLVQSAYDSALEPGIEVRLLPQTQP